MHPENIPNNLPPPLPRIKIEVYYFFFLEGTVTNPAICLLLCAVRIFLYSVHGRSNGGKQCDEIVVLVNFRERTSGNRQPLPQVYLYFISIFVKTLNDQRCEFRNLT